MPLIHKTINTDDTYTPSFTPAGSFMVHLKGTVSSNTVRVQRSIDGGASFENCTDGANGTIGLTAEGSYPINNVGTSTVYRVGCPAADFASGSFDVAVDHK